MNRTEDDLSAVTPWINSWLKLCDPGQEGASANSIVARSGPPEAPEDESLAKDDPEFVTQCLADVGRVVRGPMELGTPLLTQSKDWGLVWRVDVWEPNMDSDRQPTRIVCWKNDKGRLGMVVSGRACGKLELNR